MRKLTYVTLTLLMVVSPLFWWTEKAHAAFDKTNIISDSIYLDKSTMSAADINSFLASQGSGYASYVIPEYITVAYPVGQGTWGYVSVRQWNDSSGATFFGKTVAQLIYDESQEHNINPRVILTTLQKESSAVTENILGQPRDQWAMGYGYPDHMDNCFDTGNNCSQQEIDEYRNRAIDYGGVGQQIAYATSWFQRWYNHFNGKDLTVTIGGDTFLCVTVATRVLYYYTPHISGNQNFYNIFNGWWGDPTLRLSYDDTSPLESVTFNSSAHITGSKHVDSEVFIGSERIASTGSYEWAKDFNLSVGANDVVVNYKRSGNTVAQKVVKITRYKDADINGDSRVDLLDLSVLANNYGLKETAEPMSNLNPTVDNEVNLLDVSIFANKWEG
ncbi:MAG: hypothetical protein HZB70_03185 [Candidatus Berkelbacteria bacterium]|nr:MAG: hypothetical protein HZB70_03185 [Candidatus Berkelbacteria bacterium]QQG51695.1 MAG: hypothetical protein HY845_04005 [Candidatus Berkelbacteria bacterium]